MQGWTVTDRRGRRIYLTRERWDHIISKHFELVSHRANVLETVRLGSREQDERDPNKYYYRRRYSSLPDDFTMIEVVVLFGVESLLDGRSFPNNFILTAYGK